MAALRSSTLLLSQDLCAISCDNKTRHASDEASASNCAPRRVSCIWKALSLYH